MKRLILIVMLVLFAFQVSAATLHGAVYDSAYNLIGDVQLEVNTSPKQNYLSKEGAYFFNVPTGIFEISLEKYHQNELVISHTQIVDVLKDGEFQIDLIMENFSTTQIPDQEGPDIFTRLRARWGLIFYIGLGLLVIVGIIVAIWYFRQRGKHKFSFFGIDVFKDNSGMEVDYTVKHEQEIIGRGEDHLETCLNIIREEGGRTTQKDIRKKLPLSEAKVSLLISELEEQGKVKKIKKGRGNIIVLQ